MGGRYLCVQLLERVLTREEIQINVKDVRIRLMQECRQPLHNVTGGAFIAIITITGRVIAQVWPVAASCWWCDNSASGLRAAGSSRDVLVCSRLLGKTSLCCFTQNRTKILKPRPSVDNLLK